jgi:hypothetical protein
VLAGLATLVRVRTYGAHDWSLGTLKNNASEYYIYVTNGCYFFRVFPWSGQEIVYVLSEHCHTAGREQRTDILGYGRG